MTAQQYHECMIVLNALADSLRNRAYRDGRKGFIPPDEILLTRLDLHDALGTIDMILSPALPPQENQP